MEICGKGGSQGAGIGFTFGAAEMAVMSVKLAGRPRQAPHCPSLSLAHGLDASPRDTFSLRIHMGLLCGCLTVASYPLPDEPLLPTPRRWACLGASHPETSFTEVGSAYLETSLGPDWPSPPFFVFTASRLSCGYFTKLSRE